MNTILRSHSSGLILSFVLGAATGALVGRLLREERALLRGADVAVLAPAAEGALARRVVARRFHLVDQIDGGAAMRGDLVLGAALIHPGVVRQVVPDEPDLARL